MSEQKSETETPPKKIEKEVTEVKTAPIPNNEIQKPPEVEKIISDKEKILEKKEVDNGNYESIISNVLGKRKRYPYHLDSFSELEERPAKRRKIDSYVPVLFTPEHNYLSSFREGSRVRVSIGCQYFTQGSIPELREECFSMGCYDLGSNLLSVVQHHMKSRPIERTKRILKEVRLFVKIVKTPVHGRCSCAFRDGLCFTIEKLRFVYERFGHIGHSLLGKNQIDKLKEVLGLYNKPFFEHRVTFNKANEVCLVYDLSVIDDQGSVKEDFTSYRLKSEIMKLELLMDQEKKNPHAKVFAFLTFDQTSQRFQLTKEGNVPLYTDLKWNEILWNETGMAIRGKRFRINCLRFLSKEKKQN